MPQIALALGSALCLRDDISAALRLFAPGIIVSGPNARQRYDGRIDRVFGIGELLHALGRECNDSPPLREGGRGILLAAYALKHLADKVVIAGMPEDASAGHLSGKTYPDDTASERLRQWQRQARRWGDVVRSMSGSTRELLCTPDATWLAGGAV